jgi:hypothetical protein
MDNFIGVFVLGVLVLIPLWKLCTRTGRLPGWFSLIALVPLGFIFLLYVLAFSEWSEKPRSYSRRKAKSKIT